jgi:anaerobic magnesium-protoporphyrin IX monomethyl ester cyclase
MKILLISIYNNDNMAVRLLQPILKEKGHSCSILFFKGTTLKPVKGTLMNLIGVSGDNIEPATTEDYAEFEKFIKNFKPDIIGISTVSMFFSYAVKLSKIIRSVSKATLLWGGPHCAIAPEECVQFADYVCVGEGAESFPKFVSAYEKGDEVKDIDGFASMENGKIKVNKLNKKLINLDELPFTDFFNEDKYYLEDGKISQNGKAYLFTGCVDAPYKTDHSIVTSWGCPFQCTYCINSVVRSKSKRRSVDNVIAELRMVKDKNPYLSMINFHDDVFTMNLKWSEEFAGKYKKYIDLPFFSYTHPKSAKPEVLKVLREVGLITVCMGIQTGSDKTRKIMGRPENDEDVIKAANNLNNLRNIPYKKYGKSLIIMYDLIIKNPVETREDLNKTLELLSKMHRNYTLTLFSLSYFPKYPLTEKFLAEKLINQDAVEGLNKKDGSGSDYFSRINLKEKDPLKIMHNYYHIAFSITQYRFAPKWLFKQLINSDFWYKRIGLLYKTARFLRLISIIYNSKMFIKMGINMRRVYSPKLAKIVKKVTLIDANLPSEEEKIVK